MSQTVLGALWRRLESLLQAGPLDRSETDGTAGHPVRSDGGEREETEHLRNVPDGAGCTEIWEHLSERQTTGTEAQADD